jgi:hypothetical protein
MTLSDSGLDSVLIISVASLPFHNKYLLSPSKLYFLITGVGYIPYTGRLFI